MGNLIRLKKGYDIQLLGEATKEIVGVEAPKTIAIQPPDFRGVVPKMLVDVGAQVKCGTPLFISKTQPEVQFTSPVSGEVVEVLRGEKRRILEVRILADTQMNYEDFGKSDVNSLGREGIKNLLLKSGAWALLRQRPFNKIAETNVVPKNIFISGFDSAPLATDLNFVLKGRTNHLQAGIDALAKMTDGKVFLGLKHGADNSSFDGLKNVTVYHFDGPHPAGNVGVQIHHIQPINKGEVVWTINAQDLSIVGKLISEGVFDATRTIAITGSEINKPAYVKLPIGSNLETVLKGQLKAGKNRIISGNVLFGTTASEKGYLGFYDQQITVIPEGDEPEFMGWLIPSEARPSLSKTFLSYLTPNKKYRVNTAMHGEERPFVVTNEYEKVLPMDIYPVQLLKAILAGDLEAMEALGIYEVVEEDLSLCEFVCTSKQPVQQILSDGLTLIEREG